MKKHHLVLTVLGLITTGLLQFLSTTGTARAEKIPDADYTVAFSPSPQSQQLVVRFIDSAQKNIRIAAYSFTNKAIAEALVRAKRRGVDVKAVLDYKDNSTKKYSAAQYLANNQIPTALNDRYAILHHKFIVVDEVNLETGSFNFSAAAVTRNAENVLVLHNVKSLAMAYLKEWERMFAESQLLNSNY